MTCTKPLRIAPALPFALVIATASLSCVENKKVPPTNKTEQGARAAGGPRTIAQATLVTQKDTAPACPAEGTALDTGRELIAHGGSADGKALSVTCKVAKQSVGYLLEAKVGLADGASLSVSSSLDDEGRSAAADVVVTRPGGGKWTTDRCKLEPATDDGPGIGPGRYAATLRCRAATSPNGACDITGNIRVEDCAQ